MKVTEIDSGIFHTLFHMGDDTSIRTMGIFRPGVTIIKEGTVPKAFFLIHQGEYVAEQAGPAGLKTVSKTVDEGQKEIAIIGAASYFSCEPSKRAYRSVSAVTAYRVDSNHLVDLANNHKVLLVVRALLTKSDVSRVFRILLAKQFSMDPDLPIDGHGYDRLFMAVEEDPGKTGTYARHARFVMNQALLYRARKSEAPSIVQVVHHP
jgi:hypothetical protein